MDYYIADTPGRLRIEGPRLKGESADTGKFHDLVMGIEGVSSVEIKPIIGSATIYYNPDKIDHTRLIKLLEKSGYLDHLQAKTPDDKLEEGIQKVTEVVVDAIP